MLLRILGKFCLVTLKCRIVQKAINDTIKEHLFGPDLTSTDENSPHSPESGEEGNWQLYVEEFFFFFKVEI